MKSSIKILLVAICLAAANLLQAQDVHFSQFYTQNWLVNPAKTGFFNGNYKLSTAYRNQWSSVTSPYVTFAGSGELSWVIKGNRRNIIGMGAHAFSDKAGDAGYTTTNIGYNMSYIFCLDRFRKHYFAMGSGVSYVNSYFDLTKLKFDNEWFGTPSKENILTTKIKYADINAGIEYNYLSSKKFSMNIGGAVYHINTPRITFTDNEFSKLYRNYVFNVGADYRANSRYSFYPRVIVTMQSPHAEITAGTFVGISLDESKDEKYKVYLGMWYRYNDAVIPVARIDMGKLTMGLSYDINASKLYRASEGRGGLELTVTYNGMFAHSLAKKINCPRF